MNHPLLGQTHTPKQFAALAGVSSACIMKKIHAGTIKAVMVFGRYFINQSELVKLIRSCRTGCVCRGRAEGRGSCDSDGTRCMIRNWTLTSEEYGKLTVDQTKLVDPLGQPVYSIGVKPEQIVELTSAIERLIDMLRRAATK
jgi:hypothetical protein